jgi:hypothetical protein
MFNWTRQPVERFRGRQCFSPSFKQIFGYDGVKGLTNACEIPGTTGAICTVPT